MKSSIQFLCILYCTLQSSFLFATHNNAGEIRVEQYAPLKAKAIIITYTNANAIPADRNMLEINWGDGTTEIVVRTSKKLQDDGLNFRNEYEMIHTYPRGGVYTVFMTDIARNSGILNINFPFSDVIGFHLQTTFIMPEANSASTNTTPFLDFLVTYGTVKEKFIYKINAIDKDGDSVAYRLVTPLQSLSKPVPLYQFPQNIEPGGNNKLNFDEKTGILTWESPQKAGSYGIAIQVISYRNKVAIDTTWRDMLISITAFVSSIESDFSNLIKITPNPISTEGVLTIDDPTLQNGYLTLVDAMGRVVESAILNNKNVYVIRRESLFKGLYIIYIRNNNKFVVRKFTVE